METFEAYTKDTREGPFLRTGDLGFISDGEIYFTAR
jgi:acyl-CoA synthetase (AMP-forming)/AMP-acid ligase II